MGRIVAVNDIENQLTSFDFSDALAVAMPFEKYKKLYVNNNYFIANNNVLNLYEYNKDYINIPIVYLNQQGMSVGKIINMNASVKTTDEIIKNLINEELNWIKYYLNLVYDHLQRRVSNDKNLTSYSNIQILFGACVLKIEEVTVMMQSHCQLKDNFYQYLPEQIHSICADISTLIGGRGFLRGGSVEMLCTFDVINSIYLANEV